LSTIRAIERLSIRLKGKISSGTRTDRAKTCGEKQFDPELCRVTVTSDIYQPGRDQTGVKRCWLKKY